MTAFDVKVTVDAKSLSLAVNQFRKLGPAIADQIEKRVLKKSLQAVFDDAVRRAPVGETGNLANGIRLRIKKVGPNIYGEVISTAQHSHLIEFGHRLMRGPRKGRQKFVKWVGPRQFMRPAFLAHEKDVLPTAEREIAAILEAFSKAGFS